MIAANVVHSGNAETSKNKDMISGGMALKYLGISDRVFFPAVKYGVLVPQMTKKLKRRNELFFAISYLDEVAKVLPSERGKGCEVFTDDVKIRLVPINKQWDGKLNVDWNQDLKDTDRVLKSLSHRKLKNKKKG